jgi:hypothetical protein
VATEIVDDDPTTPADVLRRRAYRRRVPHALRRAEGARPADTILRLQDYAEFKGEPKRQALAVLAYFFEIAATSSKIRLRPWRRNYSANDRQSRNRAGKTSFIELGLR